jgi:hypothetical protein
MTTIVMVWHILMIAIFIGLRMITVSIVVMMVAGMSVCAFVVAVMGCRVKHSSRHPCKDAEG